MKIQRGMSRRQKEPGGKVVSFGVFLAIICVALVLIGVVLVGMAAICEEDKNPYGYQPKSDGKPFVIKTPKPPREWRKKSHEAKRH